MSEKWDRLSSVVMTLCAVAIAGTFVARETGLVGGVAAETREPRLVEDWESLLQYGMQIGDPGSDIQMVEFIDFQCPFCAAFHRGPLGFARDSLPEPIGISLIHFPLDIHPLARGLAGGAECANEQGAISAYADAVFGNAPVSLEETVWKRMGEQLGLVDVHQFVECAKTIDAERAGRIERGIALAREVGATGTPTVLIDGWLLPVAPDASEISRVVSAIRTGKDPY